MGLDNMPAATPCMKESTAVMDGEHVSCTLTMEAGGCPWKREREKLIGGQPIIGVFGTACWYRGKAGTWMLEALESVGAPPAPNGGTSAWYGTGESPVALTPEHCRELAEYLKQHVELYAKWASQQQGGSVEDAVEQYRYAAWWLEFVAEFGDGSDAWY